MTAPSLTEIFDGSGKGENVDYQQNRDEIFASWFKAEDSESDIVALSWCIGSEPGSCDQIQNTPIDVNSTTIHALLPQPVKDGQKNYVTVTAVNAAGLRKTVTSDGVTVDYTSPVAGKVVFGQNNPTVYIKDGDTIYVHWSEFEDTVSGIRSYEFALCEKQNASTCPLEFTDVGLQPSVTLSGLSFFILINFISMGVWA